MDTSYYQALLGLADCVYSEIVNVKAKDNSQVFLDALDRIGYKYLPESYKLFVLTYGKYDSISLSLCEVYETNLSECDPEPASTHAGLALSLVDPTFNQDQSPFNQAAPVFSRTAFHEGGLWFNPIDPFNQTAPVFNPAAPTLNQTVSVGNQGINPPQLGLNMAVQMGNLTSEMGSLRFQGPLVQQLGVEHATAGPVQMPGSSHHVPYICLDRSDRVSMSRKNPLWAYIISSDNVHYMDALLKQIPLYAIHRANTPPEVTWIESPAWMQDALFIYNARWNGQVCDYDHGDEAPDFSAKLEIMTQIAFTMHATELFSQCCKYTTINCMLYLLVKAPNLIRMKASSEKNRLALDTALLYDSAITNVLVERGAKVSGQESVRVLAEIYKKRKANVVQATKLICKENKELVKDFAQCGVNLLHIFYETIFHKGETLESKDIVACTKYLLGTGLDPTMKRFNSEENAFDTLISALKLCTPTGPNYRDLKKYVETLTACTEMILPTLQGKPAGDIDVLPFIVGQNEIQAAILVLIEQLQLILESTVHLAHNDFTFMYVSELVDFEWTDPCVFCMPVVKLHYTMLCKGYLQNSLEMLVNEVADDFQKSKLSHPFQTGQVCSTRGCCAFELLELAVYARGGNLAEHYTFAIMPLQQLICSMYDDYKDHIINGCTVILQRIARFVRMIWISCPKRGDWGMKEMFFPQGVDQKLRSFVSNLTFLVRSNDCKSDHARTFVQELDNLIATNNVLPLKTLTRQCITVHIQFKDVKYLPLPTALKVYVRLGDISPEHPIHNMSLHELARL